MPSISVPVANGLIGSFELTSAKDKQVKVAEHRWRQTTNGFETTGTLLANNGRLRQQVRLTSIGDRTVVYEDRVTALADVEVAAERGVPIGIENDKVTGEVRTVFHQGGTNVFEFKQSRPPTRIAGRWANVDGRLGVITIRGSGLQYVPARGYLPGISVGADLLYGSSSDPSKDFHAGEEIARRVVLICLETDPATTATLARACALTNQRGAEYLRCKLPEGGEAEVPLLSPRGLP